jgi:hypothetical protein
MSALPPKADIRPHYPEAVAGDFPDHVEMIVPLGGFGKKLA